ncbi:helix-turn-helix domain-containing protein [Proteiniclasticum ruminis]|uniref:PocR sensory domain-containing protein n=1 Tax=Proteiniclasticum ruminis TaxID=398199 RepID=A0A1I5BFS0_9CLOT|nr:AraC family transcriptional regulator [Proteiniclasticum ruminis]SFN73588.1 PocR sensory domain-containing protein [Proteiniclasticum ruminis]
MEYSKVEDELIEVCTSLGKVSGLEFSLLNRDAKTLFRLVLRKDTTLLKYRQQYKSDMVKSTFTRKAEEVLVYKDNLGLQYLAVSLFSEQLPYVVVGGPFLNAHVSKEELLDLLEENGIPMQDQKFLLEAYKTIKILNQEEYQSLAKVMVWSLTKKNLDAKVYYHRSRITDFKKIRPREIEESFTLIDERYRIQNKMMYYVSIGDGASAKKVMSKTVFDFSYRVPEDPLRALKNLYLTFNTILRIAVERAGVPPISIHQLSDNMAIYIERMQSIEMVQEVSDRLIEEYAALVQRMTTVGYSRHIQNAIHYLEAHLEEKILLQDVADYVHISASHLSRQFRKETGMSMTAFINKRRVDRAKALLSENQESVTTIALSCGFENLNYFSKIFREQTGMTPLHYQKQHKIQE